MNWESLNRGGYIDGLRHEFYNVYQALLDDILQAGLRKGLFSTEIDIPQMLLSIDALCLIYFTIMRRSGGSGMEAMILRR